MQQVDAERRSLAFRALPLKYNFSEADTDTFTTLPDLGFDVLPFVSESWLSDLAVVLLVVLTQIRFSLTPMGATIIRCWVFLLGSLFVLLRVERGVLQRVPPCIWPPCGNRGVAPRADHHVEPYGGPALFEGCGTKLRFREEKDS